MSLHAGTSSATAANVVTAAAVIANGALLMGDGARGAAAATAATIATSLAIGGATIGSNALAVTGPSSLAGQVTNALGTITTSTPLTLTQTWNAGAVAFTGALMNITDTASAAASLIADFQIASSSVASIDKGGRGLFGKLSGGSASDVAVGIAASRGLYSPGSSTLSLSAAGQGYAFGQSAGFVVGSAMSIGFSASADPGSTAGDTTLFRDAAGAVAQRNGVNAQTQRWYKSFTDASNYTRGAINMAANTVEIAGESAGTGDANIDILFTPKGTGNVKYGTFTATGGEAYAGYITIKDAGGTSRKLAVFA